MNVCVSNVMYRYIYVMCNINKQRENIQLVCARIHFTFNRCKHAFLRYNQLTSLRT